MIIEESETEVLRAECDREILRQTLCLYHGAAGYAEDAAGWFVCTLCRPETDRNVNEPLSWAAGIAPAAKPFGVAR